MLSQLPRTFQAVHRYTDPWLFFFCIFLFYFKELSWLTTLSWNHTRPSQCHSADFFLFSFKSVTVLLTQCSWTSRNNGRFSAFCMLQWEHIVSVQTFCYLSPCTAQPGNTSCVLQAQPALQGERWVSASQDSSPRNHQKDVRIQPFATVAAALVLSPHPNQRGPKAFTVLPAKWVITERKRFQPKSRVDSPRPEGSTALLIEGKPETQHRFIAAIVPAHVSSSSLRQESCCLSQRSWTTAARLGQASECAHKVRSTDSWLATQCLY